MSDTPKPLTSAELANLKANVEASGKTYPDKVSPITILRLIDMIERRDAWQPIETAPKDGTVILAWDGLGIFTAYWSRPNPMQKACWLGGHCRIAHIDQPTHWQPLPAPPSKALAATEPPDGKI